MAPSTSDNDGPTSEMPAKPPHPTSSDPVIPEAGHGGGEPREESSAADRAYDGFPIVAIGASAGGLEALEELFEHMPVDTGMAFVIVTHQSPTSTSLLPELLGRKTAMPVVEAVDGTVVRPDHVYVSTPGGCLSLKQGTLHRLASSEHERSRLPIDHFFSSLAEGCQDRAICIVLSGTGSDGTLGLRAIKNASGMAMAQQPDSAKYAGMPSSAIATNLVDYILKPADMPGQLVAHGKAPFAHSITTSKPQTAIIPPEEMQAMFALLRHRTGNDFSSYKTNTVYRQIERRMKVHQISTPRQYIQFLQRNPAEIDTLFNELLISVTSFFRDPAAWEALAPALIKLIQSRPDDYTLRVWIPGCSTGEEVYSLAIMVRECLEKLRSSKNIQIFGTDLDAEAIETARLGQYVDAIEGDVSPERLARFFFRDDGKYRICKEIRETVIFAPQNVIKDPPFTKLDMISCRNLLIYLNSDLQKRLLPMFHYALKSDGLLFLGPSEGVGMFTDLFESVDKRWKVFRRKGSATPIRAVSEMPAEIPTHTSSTRVEAAAFPAIRETHLATMIEKLLLDRFAPTSVVVSNRGDIVFIHGRTGMFLEPSQGQPRANIVEMAREGLQFELAAALRTCAADGTTVQAEDIRVKTNGEYSLVNLTVSQLSDSDRLKDLLLVTLQLASASLPPEEMPNTGSPHRAVDGDRIARLERELQMMRAAHQSTLVDLETSNEDLKSANEEMQSTNEELQSTNEELETSKEEMQSLNEELITVNAELHSKVEELSQTNNDMQNLLNSTDIATVFLDADLNIKRFTVQAQSLVTLRPTDVGRPITELASNLMFDGLAELCREVLRTLIPVQREVATIDSNWYLMRILPYRTTENVISGLVITFVNIRQLKEARQAEEARVFFETIFDTVREPLVVLDSEYHVVSANRCFHKMFQLHPKEVQNRPLWEIGNGEWDIVQLRELLNTISPKSPAFEGLEVAHDFSRIGHKKFLLNARRLDRDLPLSEMILLAFEDVTDTGTK